ncbi:WecB/TagA/CpsF family glycosyltransferase [Akkermansiaceae bacterium]|nr:WecB/TagA/CpsF family glycosyltransferase [Akkermansiaceae bacterium]MDA7936106.1 WecB/TagA/CpsF family glycosyltransferase [bacterium]
MALINVISTPCLVTDSADLTARITKRCREVGPEQPWSIDFTNVHIVAMRQVHDDFREETSKVDWFVPDSQILTWAVTWLGGQGNERVYGPAFLDYFVRHADEGLTHYFLGASQECLDQLLLKLVENRPGLKIVGSHNGYFGEADESAINEDINRCRPDLLWIGLGTPKQQSWAHRNKDKVQAGAILAVGFAFDVNAGTKSDAPAWMGKCGVLWLYRFLSEPRRLFKRYAVYNTIFLRDLFKQVMSRDQPAE